MYTQLSEKSNTTATIFECEDAIGSTKSEKRPGKSRVAMLKRKNKKKEEGVFEDDPASFDANRSGSGTQISSMSVS